MVIKTRQMQEMELADPQRRDIREILRDAYERGGNVTRAAEIIGITASGFSKWVDQLGGEIRSEVVFSALRVHSPADSPAVAEVA